MKTKIYLLFLLTVFVFGISFSQNKNLIIHDTSFFNYAYWNGVADKQHLGNADRAELIAVQKKIFLDEQNHKHPDQKDIVWVSEPTQSSQKGYGQNTINAGPCNNIDFEQGTMSGWVRSTGYNPLVNVIGCCPSPNGDQTIMSAGTDPYGGFPRVYPGGGSFSLRLGSTATGGIADRISQTFFVTPANANFTYRYAAVLNDGGHPASDQPHFTSEIIDTLGQPVNCTFYQASAGSSATLSGYSTSSLTANASGGNPGTVYWKNWTNVAVDLTPNIGQNVTLRFTVYDCYPGGHFAYTYIDGICTNFATSTADTTCPNVPITICAPSGFSTTTWNGPGVVNDPNLCISISTPGTYTCTTVLVPGCPGPTFTHTLTTLPDPALSFTPVTTGACSPTYTFNNTVSIPSGSIVSLSWAFGDGSTSTGTNPIHSYASSGTYPVKLRATSNRGCVDSVINFITIFPFPNLAYSPPSNCINTVVQFTNTSSIGIGSITGYTWTLGNGPTSTLINPTNTYTANGTYSINLTALSNQGCSSTLTQTLGIFPPPIISFSAAPLCDVNGTSFSPATSTAIASGSLATYLWNFGDGGTSTQANPVHIYASPGAYTVNFSALSNHSCPAATSNTLLISPSPVVAFNTFSLNACSPVFTFTNNTTISAGQVTYTWNIGGSVNNSTNAVLTHTFPSIGNYTISLIGSSNLGCLDTAVQYVSIYPYPVINFSVPASCENAIFSVSTTAVSGSVTSYSWDFGDPLSGAANTSTLQNPTHFYSSTNNYTITLNLLSNLNCPSTTITPITVFPNPLASFSYSTLNNCSLPYAYLNNSTVSAIGASTIIKNNWDFGAAGTSTLTNPGTVNFPANGSYSVSLIVTTNHNCSDTMSANILVQPFPQLDFTLTPTCQNAAVSIPSSSFISSVPAPGSIGSYTWNLGDNTFTNTLNQAPHSYSASGIYTLTLGGTSNMGCVSSITKTLAIFPVPTLSFATTGNMCFGFPTQFSSTTSISSGTIYSLNWNFGDTINTTVAQASNPFALHTYSASNSYTVNLTATTNNECAVTLTKTVTVFPLPTVSFTANNNCVNTLINFNETSTVVPTGSITSWNWNFGDGNSSGSQVTSHTYTNYAIYTPSLTVTSDKGCITTGTNNITIYPLPNISFSPPGKCVNSAIQFTNTSSIPIGVISSYIWNFSDGTPTVGVVAPLHTFNVPAVYIVTLTATSNQGCIKTSTNNLSIYPYPSVSITPINSSCVNQSVSIYPNVTITGINNPISGYTLSFGDGSPAFTSTSALQYTLTHVYSGYNTFTVSLSAISNGCQKDTTALLKVYPNPFSNFVSNKYCFHDTTKFVNTSTIAATYSIQAHNWDFGDGAAPQSTLQNTSHVFSGPGTYSVNLTEFSFPEPGVTCSVSAVKILTINPSPIPSFVSNSVCLGNATQFNNTTPTLGVTGWSWYTNNNPVFSISANPAYTYTTSGKFLTRLLVLNNFGCRDSLQDTVRVYANPTASFVTNNICLGNQSVFSGQTPTLLAVDGSLSTYTWNTNGNPAFSSFQDAVFTYSAQGTYTVEYNVGSTKGCVGKYVKPVIVYPTPNISFTATEVCQNNPTQFINQTSIFNGSVASYLWSFNDPAAGTNSTSILINPSHSFPGIGTYAATLEAVSNNGCQGTPKTINVLVHGNPKANFTHTTICVGDKFLFANLSSSSDGTITSNQWDFNGDNTVDLDSPAPAYTYTIGGIFNTRLKVITQFGCSDTMMQQVLANPKAIPAIGSNNRSGCPSLCINFKNLSTIASGSIISTLWDFGDGSPASTFTSVLKCYDAGTYDIGLTMISDAGCTTRFISPGYVSVYPLPVAGFKVDPEEIDEDEPLITVSNQSSADASTIKYYINDGSSFGSANFTHIIKNLKQTKPMVVQIVSNKYGCSDTIFQLLNIKPSYVVYFPDVFTPNGDGTNDDFRPKGVGILKFNMQIFDRWDNQVFNTNDITVTWDGRSKSDSESIKEDVYTWKAQVTDVFNKSHFLVGRVAIIR